MSRRERLKGVASSSRFWLSNSEGLPANVARAFKRGLTGELPVLSGGTALFAVVGMVPALSAMVSVYGLVVDPSRIGLRITKLSAVLPHQVIDFVIAQLTRMVQTSHSVLGVQLFGSLVAAAIASRSASRSMIVTLDRAYRVGDVRKGWRRQGATRATGGIAFAGILGMFVVLGALPILVSAAHLNGFHLVKFLRWPMIFALVVVTLGALFRVAPSPRPFVRSDRGERRIWPGAWVATVLLVLVSFGFSAWVEHIGSYDAVYGTLGSVVIVILWFYFSVLAVVIGACINGELEVIEPGHAPRATE
ncbi:YihY/virulence factor BrkB family protein [soil metagenome]